MLSFEEKTDYYRKCINLISDTGKNIYNLLELKKRTKKLNKGPKKDYLEYFQEIARIEVEMQEKGRELASYFADPRIKKMLEGLIQDEARHAKIVTNMIKLIENEK